MGKPTGKGDGGWGKITPKIRAKILAKLLKNNKLAGFTKFIKLRHF